MILGQSIFDAVMGRLKEEHEETDSSGEDTAWQSVRGLNAGFVSASYDHAGNIPTGQVADAYSAFMPDTPEIEPQPTSPEPSRPDESTRKFARLTPEEIAEEMELSASDTAASLQAKRRAFARLNHPDTVAPQWRDQANLRMKIANLLVDEALRHNAA